MGNFSTQVLKKFGSSNIDSPFESNISTNYFSFSISYSISHPTRVIIAGLWVHSGLPLKEDAALL